MKRLRILGILWVLFCGYVFYDLFQWTLYPDWPGVSWRDFVRFYLQIFFCLLNLAGMVAATFLFRGARWARWFIVLVALLIALTAIDDMVWLKSVSVWAAFYACFSLVSIPLLLFPKSTSK
jgi:hypothetical protein